MGERYFNTYKPSHVSFTQTWGNKPRLGRWFKRRLSKARRRYIKQLLWYGRGKEPTSIESEVSWKGW